MESVLELYVLSLIDRSLETAYDLQVHGKVSLGSSIPALKRLEAAGSLKRKPAGIGSRKGRQAYGVTAAGRRKLAAGSSSILAEEPPSDIDSILRIVDIWRASRSPSTGMKQCLDRAVAERTRQTKTLLMVDRDGTPGLEYLAESRDWNLIRLRAETKFLTQLAKTLG